MDDYANYPRLPQDYKNRLHDIVISQQTFTCSKLTIETVEEGVKYYQSQKNRHQNDAINVALVHLLLTWTIFHTFSSVSIIDFEKVNVSLVETIKKILESSIKQCSI